MNSNELYQKYLDAEKERFELENKIESYVEKWKNGETVLSNQAIQQAMEKGYERLFEKNRYIKNYFTLISEVFFCI